MRGRELIDYMVYPVSIAIPPAVMGVLLLTLDDRLAQPGFFDAASQLVAVLLIALILEVRVLTRTTAIEQPGMRGSTLLTGAYILVMLILAEQQCLRVLANDQPGSSKLVVVGLISGTLALVMSALVHRRTRS